MRIEQRIRLAACGVTAMLLAACSQPEPTAVAVATPAPAAKRHFKACDLVTAAEMSTILGRAVTATTNDRSPNDVGCVYTPAGASEAILDLRIEDGAGPATMAAAGLAGSVSAGTGMLNPLQGVGEQAVYLEVAGQVMIDAGDDLVQVSLTDIADPLPKVRRIYEIARPRM